VVVLTTGVVAVLKDPPPNTASVGMVMRWQENATSKNGNKTTAFGDRNTIGDTGDTF
jgi:hypothetical protein